MHNKKQINNSLGFTLMEMLIVVTIIGFLATFVGVKVLQRFEEAKVKTTVIQIQQLGVVLDDFKRVCGFYPLSEQGLEALIKAPAGRECKGYDPEGFLRDKKIPEDAWGNAFFYQSDGNKYVLKSFGADKKEGGEKFDKDLSSDNST